MMKTTLSKLLGNSFFGPIFMAMMVVILCLPHPLFGQTAGDPLGNTTPPSAQAHSLGTTDTIQISDDGTVTVTGAEIIQLAGSTFFTRVYWGDTFLRITVRTDDSTKFTKHYGGAIGLSDISAGDFITVQGVLYTGESILDMTASSVKDWSIQTEGNEFAGTVTSIATTTNGFYMRTGVAASNSSGSPANAQQLGQILVNVSNDTNITKGTLSDLPLSAVKVGDTILLANGIYDHGSNTLSATSVKIYQDMGLFVPQNFIGTIKTISGNTLPLDITLAIQSGSTSATMGSATYVVKVPLNASILAANRSKASVARFLVGDSIRVYGAIRETDHSIIDAQIVRNLDL